MAVESSVTYDNIQFHKNTVQPDAMLLEQLIESSATTILMDYLTLPSREEKTPVTVEDFQKDIESVVHMLKEHHGDLTIRILVSSLEEPLVKQWIYYCQKKGLGLFLRWIESPTMEARLAYHLGCDKTYGHSMEAFLKDMENVGTLGQMEGTANSDLTVEQEELDTDRTKESGDFTKPKLLYASPLPPVRSGISEYSVQLVQALATQYDITLYTEQTDLAKEEICGGKYAVLYPGDPVSWDDYDVKMYHIGNNYEVHSYIYEAAMMHPGVVVLHDTNIYYLFQAYHGSRHNFYQKIYEYGGLEEFLSQKWERRLHGLEGIGSINFAKDHPCTEELIASGNRILVHSKHSYQDVADKITRMERANLLPSLDASSEVTKRNMLGIFPHLILEEDASQTKFLSKEALYEKFHLPKDAMIIGSFGFITKSKMNLEASHAVKQLRKEHPQLPLIYLMVGDGNDADEALEDGVVMKTGYVTIEEFQSFLHYADIVVSFRSVSFGEVSGAMLRILQQGKACITNDEGWFSELPEDVVVKIPVAKVEEELPQVLLELLTKEEKRLQLGAAARNYAYQEHSPEKVMKVLAGFLNA